MIALCLWASAAFGADVAEEADHLFQLGIRDYSDGDYESALAHLLASFRLVPNRNVEFNIARVYEQLGKLDLAWRHYHEYVLGTPDPTARADGEAALARLDKDVARVKVTSSPSGATVFVGRVDLGPHGVTPITLALPAGKRSIVLDLDGYVRAETTAELVTGKESRTAVELLPAPALPSDATKAPFLAVVRAGAEVVVTVDESSCALLPARVQGAGAVRPGSWNPAEVAPGSVLAALGPLPPLSLDVTVRGLTTRTELARVRQGMLLDEAAALRTWVFDRCTPMDPRAPGVGLAAGLAALSPGVRQEAVAVFAEWAATRGGGDVLKASAACVSGECAALVASLVAK